MIMFISYFQFYRVAWILQVARNLVYLDHRLTSMHRTYQMLKFLLNE